MKEYLKSPMFWVATIIGVRWMYKNKPNSKLTHMFREFEEGAENAAYQTTNYARKMANEGVDTIQDGLGALGWEMGDGDDIASQDLDPGVGVARRCGFNRRYRASRQKRPFIWNFKSKPLIFLFF